MCIYYMDGRIRSGEIPDKPVDEFVGNYKFENRYEVQEYKSRRSYQIKFLNITLIVTLILPTGFLLSYYFGLDALSRILALASLTIPILPLTVLLFLSSATASELDDIEISLHELASAMEKFDDDVLETLNHLNDATKYSSRSNSSRIPGSTKKMLQKYTKSLNNIENPKNVLINTFPEFSETIATMILVADTTSVESLISDIEEQSQTTNEWAQAKEDIHDIARLSSNGFVAIVIFSIVCAVATAQLLNIELAPGVGFGIIAAYGVYMNYRRRK